MRDDVRLRVRGAASVERSVALGQLVGRGVPLLLVACGDDVVVPVEQDGGRAFRSGDLADHDRRRVRQLERMDVLDPGALEQLDDGVPAREELRVRLGRVARCRHRRDRDEACQVRFSSGISDAIASLVGGLNGSSQSGGTADRL